MSLQPLPYHRCIVELLRTEVPQSWDWYERARQSATAAEQMRIELLKCTYRLDRSAHGALYDRLAAVAAGLGVTGPITCYQAQGAGTGLNASLWYQPDEVHIVFQGSLLEQLSPVQIDAVAAHELGHHRLWSMDGGAFGTADRLLSAIAQRPDAEPCHHQTRRNWDLATEIYADRCSLLATGDIAAVIAALVRIETGAAAVDAQAYIRQAREVLAAGCDRSQGTTHPECFIRAVALDDHRQHQLDADARIERLLTGPLDPAALDVLGQQTCTAITRDVIATLLAPAWMRTERTLAHARMFFPDAPPGPAPAAIPALVEAAPGLRDYVCHVVLDFVAADGELGEAALARGLAVADGWGWADRLAELAGRELKWKAKDLTRIRRELPALQAAAEAQVRSGAGDPS
ncbi:MAG: hypothetical protein RLZZ127_269 [Planctomycetota bacterium]|jgi:hypothetical protein